MSYLSVINKSEIGYNQSNTRPNQCTSEWSQSHTHLQITKYALTGLLTYTGWKQCGYGTIWALHKT